LCCAQFFQEAPVIARRTPEWFSRADDEAIFFYCNRKEIEIASLAGLDRNGGRSRTRRPAWEWEYQGCQVARSKSVKMIGLPRTQQLFIQFFFAALG
jgi:hypothetical protein